ncbi:MAG: S41 family peptidase [Candidatus Omnitrophica bacterium]|nr:S41 family peptidase [Candidatus Omnitrophota bacterium]
MKNRKFYLFIVPVIIFCVLFCANDIFSKEPDSSPVKPLEKKDIYNELELFADTITIVNANYVDDVNSQDLIYGALKGMLRSLDAHSDFLTPEQYEDIKIDTGGEFGGLGIEITMEDNLLTVVTPLEGSPAQKAGLMPQDKIIKINGEITRDMNLDDAVKRMRGTPGSEITLGIMREGEEKIKDYKIKRAVIKIRSVKDAFILEDGFGYMRITEFQQKTGQEIEKALRALEAEKLTGLILDLRNNPGGLLEAAVDVSEKFLPKDTLIVSIKGKNKQQNVVFKARSVNSRINFPMVVLVNKGSASASEIVAAAIKENERGIVLGTTTFGKGSVQTVIPLRDRSALRLTTSKYYTPRGNEIHNKGVVPNVIVEKEGQDKAADSAPIALIKKIESGEKESRISLLRQDNQVKSALEVLKGIKIYSSFRK